MSVIRLVVLGSYVGGLLALALGVVLRLGLQIGDVSPRGALVFAGACFLCTLATREIGATIAKPKEQAQQARGAAA